MKRRHIKLILSFALAMVFALSPCILFTTTAASALGDVDGSGTINSTDALLVLHYATGATSMTEAQKRAADVNGDGKINSVDALEILKFAVNGTSQYLNPNTTTKTTAFTAYQGKVTAEPSLRLRSGPGTNYSILVNVPYGTVITITAVSNGWGKTTYSGKTGWVSLDYVTRVTNPTTTTTTRPTTTATTKKTTTTTRTTTTTTNSSSYQGRVTADPSLRLRSGPGTSYSTLTYIPYGTIITITAVSGGWGKTTYNGKTGWVSLDYVARGTTPAVKSGTFTITCYGYGHGAGMSQYGAIYLANDGWKYDQILLHYYHSSKTKILTDNNMPSTVTYGGTSYNMKQYLAGSTYAEIGDDCNMEALKAQVVAIYTYAKYYNFKLSSSTHAYKSYSYKGTRIEQAINAVWKKYIAYDNKAILAVYCSSMGGKNTSALNAWNGADIPYLQGGMTSPEPESIMKRVYTFTADEVKSLAKNRIGVTLSGDPSKWFTEIKHDKAISDSVGYIRSMKVGGTTVYGENIRAKLFAYKIRSHCISIQYNP